MFSSLRKYWFRPWWLWGGTATDSSAVLPLTGGEWTVLAGSLGCREFVSMGVELAVAESCVTIRKPPLPEFSAGTHNMNSYSGWRVLPPDRAVRSWLCNVQYKGFRDPRDRCWAVLRLCGRGWFWLSVIAPKLCSSKAFESVFWPVPLCYRLPRHRVPE